MTYKLTQSGEVMRTSDGARVPFMEGHGYYTEYLEWLAEGNTPEPADPMPEPIPSPTLADQILADPSELAKLKKALGL